MQLQRRRFRFGILHHQSHHRFVKIPPTQPEAKGWGGLVRFTSPSTTWWEGKLPEVENSFIPSWTALCHTRSFHINYGKTQSTSGGPLGHSQLSGSSQQLEISEKTPWDEPGICCSISLWVLSHLATTQLEKYRKCHGQKELISHPPKTHHCVLQKQTPKKIQNKFQFPTITTFVSCVSAGVPPNFNYLFPTTRDSPAVVAPLPTPLDASHPRRRRRPTKLGWKHRRPDVDR